MLLIYIYNGKLDKLCTKCMFVYFRVLCVWPVRSSGEQQTHHQLWDCTAPFLGKSVFIISHHISEILFTQKKIIVLTVWVFRKSKGQFFQVFFFPIGNIYIEKLKSTLNIIKLPYSMLSVQSCWLLSGMTFIW